MTVTSTRSVRWVRISGIGDSTGTAYLWTTGPLTTGPIGEFVIEGALLASVDAPPSPIDILGTAGADSAITIPLRYDAPGVSYLIQAQRTVAASAGAAARLARSVTLTGTTVVITDTSALTDGDVIWIDREAMLIDSVDDATTLTVTRAVCGTYAQTHALPAVRISPWGTVDGRNGGPRVYTSPPPPIGAWLVYGETVVVGVTPTHSTLWVGQIDSASLDSGAVVQVRARSLLGVARDRKATDAASVLPWGRTYGVGGYDVDWSVVSTGVQLATVSSPYVYFDRDVTGDDRAPAYVRYTATDGRWVVLRVSATVEIDIALAALSGSLRTIAAELPTLVNRDTPIQLGDADGVLAFEALSADDRRTRTLRDDHILAVLGDPNGVWTWAVSAAANLATIVGQALSVYDATVPAGWADIYPPAFVDTGALALAVINTALVNNEPQIDAPLWVWPPAGDAKTVLARLQRDLLLILGVGLTHDTGVIVGVDWAVRADVGQTLGASDARNRPYQWSRSDRGAVAAAVITRRDDSLIEVSDRVDPLADGEAILDVPISSLRSVADVSYRWSALVYRYGVPLPSLVLVTSIPKTVGEYVRLTRPDLPIRTGADAVDYDALIVGRGRNSDGDSTLALVVVGWHEDEPGHRWGPTARVVSSSGGAAPYLVTVESAPFSGTDDAGVFQSVPLPLAVQVLDSTGALVETGTVISTGADTLSLDDVASAPTAGQYIVLGVAATSTALQAARWAWLADASGLVTGGDPSNWGP